MINKNWELGTSIAVKIGSKYPSINDWRHYQNWRHGQIVEIRELGYAATSTTFRKHNLIIDLPNVPYWKLRGTTDWKDTKRSIFNIKKYISITDEHGKYIWDHSTRKMFNAKKINGKSVLREWVIDPEWLLRKKYITSGQWESIYDKSREHDPVIISNVFNLNQIIKHETNHTRLSNEKDQSPGSVSSGTYQIGTGAGADYATFTLANADIASQLTGNLTFEHQDEETAMATTDTVDTDTNSYLLKFTAESGAEHTGGAYGNGARINYGAYDYISLNETTDGDLDDLEISKLAFDASGTGNVGLYFLDGGNDGDWLCNRVLIKGDSNADTAIYLSANSKNITVRNTCIYDFTGGSSYGIIASALYYGTYNSQKLYNNTVINCTTGIYQQESSLGSATAELKNNLCQDNTTDYADNGAGWSASAKNISEDATSPNASYRSKDLHTNTVFTDYANDDFRIDADGDATNLAIVDDGEDLSAIFTDDIQDDSRRSDPYDIGSSQRTSGGGTNYDVSVTYTSLYDISSSTPIISIQSACIFNNIISISQSNVAGQQAQTIVDSIFEIIPDERCDTFGAVALQKSLFDNYSSRLDHLGSIVLDIISQVGTAATKNTYDSITLTLIDSITNQGITQFGGNLSLDVNTGVTESGLVSALGSLDLSQYAGIENTNQQDIYTGVSLSFINDLVASTSSSYGDTVQLDNYLGVNLTSIKIIYDNVNLNIINELTLNKQSGVVGSINLDLNKSITSTAIASALDSIDLSLTLEQILNAGGQNVNTSLVLDLINQMSITQINTGIEFIPETRIYHIKKENRNYYIQLENRIYYI